MLDAGRPVRRVTQSAVMLVVANVGGIGCAMVQRQAEAEPVGPPLRIETVGSDSTAFAVTATLIIGPTEAVLWDRAIDSPAVIQIMLEYLNDFDRLAKLSQSADELVRGMSAKYSNHSVSSLLRASARRVIPAGRDAHEGWR